MISFSKSSEDSNQEISNSIASLSSINEIYVREENDDISTHGYWDHDFSYEIDMNLPKNSISGPIVGIIKFGTWKYTRNWLGYYENERIEVETYAEDDKENEEDTKNELRKTSFMELTRFVSRDMINKKLQEKFPFLHLYRTMGWEWDFDQNNNKNLEVYSRELDHLAVRILHHFMAYSVESETNEIDVYLNSMDSKLRVVDANPGGNGLSEALLLDGRMMNALSDCEKTLIKFSNYPNEDKFKKYIKQLCQVDPVYSAKEVLTVVHELHENWGKLDASSLNAIGASNLEKGYTEKAIGYFEKALEIEPDCLPAQMNKGIAYAKSEKYYDAIGCFNLVIKLNPKHYFAWKESGKAYYQLKKYVESVECFEFVLELDSTDATALSNLGIALLAQGNANNNRALECFNKAIEINPRYAEAWHCRSLVLKKLGRMTEAEDSETKARNPNLANELNYFKSVDNIIQSIFELDISSIHEKNLTEILREREKEMQKKYYNDQQIDYSDIYNQIIYLYKYVPCHADLLRCVFENRESSLKEFFHK